MLRWLVIPLLFCACLSAQTPGPTGDSSTQEIQQLKELVQQLQSRVARLEAQQSAEHTPASANAAVSTAIAPQTPAAPATKLPQPRRRRSRQPIAAC